jgi:hypothetical protein
MNKLLLFIFITAGIVSCKTDFEVNAPYEKVPIVYGILEQNVDTQFIKINKTFLGTDNLNYSHINDSMLFNNVTARVEQYTNGTLGNVYNLQEIWVKNINNGIFYTDSQKVYYFIEPNLNSNSEYKITGTADGKEFNATTTLVQPFSFSVSFRNSVIYNNNAFSMAGDMGVYSTLHPKWNSGIDGKRYDLSLRFNYNEYKGASITPKHIDWYLGSQKVISSSNSSLLQTDLNGESFYQYLGNNSELQNTTGVTKRVFKSIDLRVTAANENFNTYMEVNEPVTSIVTERPEFTNITGGYGLFASRTTLGLINKTLTEKSIEELAGGQYTGAMLFCSDSVVYIGESYYCP